MGEGLDVEALRTFITRYFEAMSSIIAKHGGLTEKFIGDAVVGVFGVPIVREDDALRAVRAAWAMQQAMQELTAQTDPANGPKVRIGVNTGEVVAGDPSAGHGFVSGDTMNVAARLEQAAPPGEILIGETTHRIVRDYVEVEPTPPLVLKGKAEAVQAFLLKGVQTSPQPPEQERVALVGRELESQRLVDAFETMVDQSEPRWVTVVAEAGVGKTALIQDFKSRLTDRAVLLEGRCLSYGEGITFWPLAEILKKAAGITETDQREEARDKIRRLAIGLPDAELVSGRLASALALSDEIVSTQEIFWATRMLLEYLASLHPVVIVIEDLHWAEETLLDLVEYLTSFGNQLPLFVLCVARSQLMERRPSWFARTTLLSLRPLEAEHGRELLVKLLGELPPAVAEEILAASQGNPLYLQEIARMVMEQGPGRTPGAGDRSLWTITIPPTIQALLSARLEQLPIDERSVVQRGSVIGREFWSGALAALSTEELRDEIGRQLQALVRREVLTPTLSDIPGEDGFGFTHILMRDAAYNALPKKQRADLHERAAAWIGEHAGDRLPEYEEVLGYHLESSASLRREIGETGIATDLIAEQAARTLVRPARRAAASGDAPAASSLLERAMRLLDNDHPLKRELALELGSALVEAGNLRAASTAIETALELGHSCHDARVLAHARLQTQALHGLTDHARWVADAEGELLASVDEMKRLNDRGGQAKALHLLAELMWDQLRTSEAQGLVTEALEHARAADDRVEEGKILTFLASAAFWGPLNVQEAIALCEKIRDEGADDQLLQARIMRSLAGLRAMRGEFDRARTLVTSSQRLQADLGQHLSVAYGTQYSGLIELLAGDPHAAVKQLEEGFAGLEAMEEEAYLSTQAALLARAKLATGDLEGALELTARSELASEGEIGKAEWAPTRARVLAQLGDLETARELADAAVELTAAHEDVFSAGESLIAAGEVALAGGDLSAAKSFYEAALAVYSAKGIAPWVSGIETRLSTLDGVTRGQ